MLEGSQTEDAYWHLRLSLFQKTDWLSEHRFLWPSRARSGHALLRLPALSGVSPIGTFEWKYQQGKQAPFEYLAVCSTGKLLTTRQEEQVVKVGQNWHWRPGLGSCCYCCLHCGCHNPTIRCNKTAH
ncbi:hypothetical protein M514_05281, partial [Trichuris suis]